MDRFQLDTTTLEAAARRDLWAAAVTGAFGPFAIDGEDPDRFRGHVSVERRDGLRFIRFGYEGHGFRRRPRDVSRLDDAFFSLMRPTRGRLHLRQDGTTRVLEAGHFYVVNHSLPYETWPEDGYETEAVAFAPSALESRVARLQPFYALRDDPTCPRSALLSSYLGHFAAGRHDWNSREFARLTEQLLDLVVLSIIEPGSDTAAAESGARAAHRTRALAFIRSRLGDRRLTPGAVAEACNISLSYLTEIFRESGEGVEATIFAERLDHARALLDRPDSAGVPVSTIAYRLGFADPAHFSRAFRRRFGLSPSEARG